MPLIISSEILLRYRIGTIILEEEEYPISPIYNPRYFNAITMFPACCRLS